MNNEIFRGFKPDKPEKKRKSRKQKRKEERKRILKSHPSRTLTEEEWEFEDNKYRGSV